VTAGRRALSSAELLAGLSRAAAFPGSPAEVTRRETHASWLFFTEQRVYKVKKPVDLGFLDFTTLERRRFFCEEELRLNRRLAPRVYRAVLPIMRAADGPLGVGGEGEPLEWAVEMERLPDAALLASRLAHGVIDNADLDALVDLLVPFHAAAPTGPGVDEHGTPEAVARPVLENFAQLVPFVEPDGRPAVLSRVQLEFLERSAREFLTREHELLERRVSAGRIREGHGDLHAENLCLLPDGPVAYDCLEFDQALRCGDVACDLAFLAMDLDRRGVPGSARYLVHRYAGRAGDADIARLIDFYKAYRAVVRGKVGALTAAGMGPDDPRRAAVEREARCTLQLAVGYGLGPRLLLLAGLPASGKSTLARALSGPLCARLLSSDERRRHVTPGRPEGYGVGKYADSARQRVYDTLREDAEHTLAQGSTVIVDATFSKRAFRAAFVALARDMAVPVHLVEVTATAAESRRRLAERQPTPEGSEADLEVWERAREAWEPPDELPDGQRISVASDNTPERLASVALDALIGTGC
jgi:aminoglycoside phosphotransferase family enzyme/predicted kinase